MDFIERFFGFSPDGGSGATRRGNVLHRRRSSPGHDRVRPPLRRPAQKPTPLKALAMVGCQGGTLVTNGEWNW